MFWLQHQFNNIVKTTQLNYIYIYISFFVIQTAATQYTGKKRIKEMDTKRTHTSLKPE